METRINSQARLTLITGPARSGKTRLAVQWALGFPSPRVYIATAPAMDKEMAERIRRHRQDRGTAFQTLEEPLALSALLRKVTGLYSILIIDCLTLWMSNLLGHGEGTSVDFAEEIRGLLKTIKTYPNPLLFIGNEVGWGIVPENPLARRYRDEIGRLHQEIGRLADQVILMVAGIPLVIKKGGPL